jgi:hypothetical protein
VRETRRDHRVWLSTGTSSGFGRALAAYESAPMPEYAETVGPTRAYVRGSDGAQPGDPAKEAATIIAALDAEEPPLRLVLGEDAIEAAATIIAALDAEEPPLRLVLGEDAIDRISRRLESVSEELEAWRSVGAATALKRT